MSVPVSIIVSLRSLHYLPTHGYVNKHACDCTTFHVACESGLKGKRFRVAGLDFSAGPPVPTGKIPGGPAMFVLNPSVRPVEFYPSIYYSDPTYFQSFSYCKKCETN